MPVSGLIAADRPARCHRLQLNEGGGRGARVSTPFIAFELYNRGRYFRRFNACSCWSFEMKLNVYIRMYRYIYIDIYLYIYIYVYIRESLKWIWKFRSIRVPRRGSTRFSRSFDRRAAEKLCSLEQDFQKGEGGEKKCSLFLRCVHGNGIKNVAIAASTIRSTSNMRHEQTRGLSCLCMQIRECRCSAPSSCWPRVVVAAVARCSRISRPKTNTWNCWRDASVHLPSLLVHKIHILARKEGGWSRENFVDHVVSEANTPF